MLMLMGVLTPLKANERPVSLAFDDAPVGQVLQALADWQNLNLMVAPEVQGTLSPAGECSLATGASAGGPHGSAQC